MNLNCLAEKNDCLAYLLVTSTIFPVVVQSVSPGELHKKQ